MSIPHFCKLQETLLVVTLDAARARLFWLEPSPRTRLRLHLREDEQSFAQPDGSLPSRKNARPVSARAYPLSVPAVDGDKESVQPGFEEKMRFARELADSLDRIVQARGVDELLVVADQTEQAPVVRELVRKRLPCDLRHATLDATTLSPADLYETLHTCALLP